MNDSPLRPFPRVARRPAAALICALAMAALGAQAAGAQPFQAWYTNNGVHRYISVPHHASLNPSGAFTLEAWVFLSSASGCRSLVGKGFTDTWWIGACGVSSSTAILRSYLAGTASLRDGGIIPFHTWTHIAVTYDGAHRRHYINGELAAEFAQVGALPGNGDALRLASDVDFGVSPDGALDEVRLWNVARTLAQLRANLNRRITTAQPGLVAVWPLDGSGNDVVGARDGSLVNSPIFFTFAVALDCGSSTATTLCLNTRYQVRAWWRTDPPATPVDGQAQVVPFTTADSGLFWFFAPSNWEVMVKVLNGCGLNNRYWVFSAATTNVFYRLEVFDVAEGAQKIYFNYPGPPAPAVTDTGAFATCPP